MRAICALCTRARARPEAQGPPLPRARVEHPTPRTPAICTYVPAPKLTLRLAYSHIANGGARREEREGRNPISGNPFEPTLRTPSTPTHTSYATLLCYTALRCAALRMQLATLCAMPKPRACACPRSVPQGSTNPTLTPNSLPTTAHQAPVTVHHTVSPSPPLLPSTPSPPSFTLPEHFPLLPRPRDSRPVHLSASDT